MRTVEVSFEFLCRCQSPHDESTYRNNDYNPTQKQVGFHICMSGFDIYALHLRKLAGDQKLNELGEYKGNGHTKKDVLHMLHVVFPMVHIVRSALFVRVLEKQ
jgi:hypothetical protein